MLPLLLEFHSDLLPFAYHSDSGTRCPFGRIWCKVCSQAVHYIAHRERDSAIDTLVPVGAVRFREFGLGA